MLVARALSPSAYGDLTFLLGSFVALQLLLDMGTSSAFYTLISQQARAFQFYVIYFAWQGLQFLAAATFVGLLCPPALLNAIWLGHSRGLVILAFIAVFAQQQLWQAISQIGEGSRQSVRVQAMNLSIALVHLILVGLCTWLRIISVSLVFCLITMEYTAAIISSYWFLRHGVETEAIPALSFSATLRAYWIYCKPLTLLAVVTFVYFFADRWLLQRFGGGAQQGFYQISAQFAGVALLATTSILKIFWKEIAEAQARQDRERVQRLHRKVFRGLIMVSAAVAGLFMPWSGNIVVLLLGKSYTLAGPVLTIMFLYPILQAMGQINGTALLASGETRAYTTVSSVFMLLSVPITYFVEAPASAQPVRGLGAGAIGMAIKMVGLALFSINVQAWVLARRNRWKFDWSFQFVAIGAVLLLGYTARSIVTLFWHIRSEGLLPLLPPFLCCTVVYGTGLAVLIWHFPTLVGMEESELRHIAEVLCCWGAKQRLFRA
jgi:O-antigen/teichoic acid export membrane protein